MLLKMNLLSAASDDIQALIAARSSLLLISTRGWYDLYGQLTFFIKRRENVWKLADNDSVDYRFIEMKANLSFRQRQSGITVWLAKLFLASALLPASVYQH